LFNTADGSSVRAYLAEENQAKLGKATAAFRAAIARPGFAEAFDRDFGGLPELAHRTHRAA
jgi:hypothetical protein